MNISNLFVKNADEVLVVDISSNLKLINIQLPRLFPTLSGSCISCIGRRDPIATGKDQPEGSGSASSGRSRKAKITALNIFELSGDKREEKIKDSIRSFIKENGIQHQNCVLSPSLSFLIIKRLQLPAVPDKELLEAIKWQIKDDVPFDLSEAIIKYHLIKKETKEDGAKTFDIICVAAKEDEIKKQVVLLTQIGLRCSGVGVSIFGYAKLIEEYAKEARDEAVGILHMTEDSGYFAILHENKLNFYRQLPVSIAKLRESLTQVLISVKGKEQLTPDEIDKFLFKTSKFANSSIYNNKIAVSQILAMLRPGLERLAQEIKRSLAYYDAQFKGPKEGALKNILIAGEAGRIFDLDKILSVELSLPVSVIFLKEEIESLPSVNSDFLSRSYAAFGLGVGLDREINLLPQEFCTGKIEKLQKISLRWAAFLVFLLMLLPYIFAKAGLDTQQKRLDNTLAYQNVLSEVKKIKQNTDALSNFAEKVRDSDFPVGSLLKEFSKAASQDIFLKGLLLNCQSKTGTIIGFVKNGDASPNVILAEFVGKMNNSRLVVGAKIDSVDKGSGDGLKVDNFKISFQLP